MSIPKIIHQIWIGPNPPPLKWLNSWKDLHPDWDYRLWTTTYYEIRNQEAYNISPRWCGKSDILRYELLYDYGGIYLDADIAALKRLDDLLEIDEELFVVKHDAHSDLIANAIIGVAPNSPFIKKLIDGIPEKPTEAAWIETGPLHLTNMIQEHKPSVKILGHESFIPFWQDEFVDLDSPKCKDSYGVHYWGTTNANYNKGR